MECKFCGKQYNETEATCPHCGKTAEAAVSTEELMDAMPELHNELDRISEMRDKAEHRKRRRVIAAAVFLVILACIGAGWGAMYYFNLQASLAEETSLERVPVTSGVPGEAVEKFFGENFTDLLITDENSAQTAIESVKADFGITSTDVSFRLEHKVTVGGDTYYRFAQVCGGLDVYGGEVIVAATGDGTPIALHGVCIETDGLDFSAGIEAGKASNVISEYVNKLVESYRVNEGAYITDPEKIICNFEGKTYLAYMANVSGYNEKGEYVAYDVFVDADAGSGIFLSDTASYENEEIAAAETPVAEPIEPVVAEVPQDAYFSIHTVNDKFNWNDKTKTSALDEISMEDIRSGVVSAFVAGTTTAVDKAYTYFDKKFNWQGLDGKNGAFRVYLNANEYVADRLPPEKAIYSDEVLMFIQEDLTVNEVNGNIVTHEYAHGVMHHIAGLKGTTAKNENAAMAEGFADVFAELAEGNAPDWMHGERNLSELQTGYLTTLPATVLISEIEDCYRYSTIVSHAAYQMHANGVSTDALSELYFRTLCLMTKHSDFSHWRSVTEFSAKKMVDAGTLSEEQFAQVVSALDKTGIEGRRLYQKPVEALAEEEINEEEMLDESEVDPNEKVIE